MVHWLHFNIRDMQNRSLCYSVLRRSNAVVVERSIKIVSLMTKDSKNGERAAPNRRHEA